MFLAWCFVPALLDTQLIAQLIVIASLLCVPPLPVLFVATTRTVSVTQKPRVHYTSIA
jgi:hypothetical protein